MHYSAVVLVPAGTEDVEEAVAALMEPHRETRHTGWWDWYRIGGRWDGTVRGVSRGARCVRCQANDIDCHYSSEHSQLKHNMIAVAEMGEVRPHTVVAPDIVRHRETWVTDDPDPMKWAWVEDPDWSRTLATILLSHRDHVAVGLDYHS